METKDSIISSIDTRNSILNHIINCANSALTDDSSFKVAMYAFANGLRTIFCSEYCAIGKVVDGIAEDCIIALDKSNEEAISKLQEEYLKSVSSAHINQDDCVVCRALKSQESIYYENNIESASNFNIYKKILKSQIVNNTIVIPIRESKYKELGYLQNFGYIQFINCETNITSEDISPFMDAFLGLIQIIIKNQSNLRELKRQENRLKDASTFQTIIQEKNSNIEDLLEGIMEYLSKEFNAAIISFRIPVLNGYDREPLFYTRSCFIHESIDNQKVLEIKKLYYNDWLLKNDKQIGGFDDFKCINRGKILESLSQTNFSKFDLDLDDKTLIMPIFRDFGDKCINTKRNSSDFCLKNENSNCLDRFKNLYGIFRLRISNTDLSNNQIDYTTDFDETKERLSYLSEQITLRLNSIVDKYENDSLQTFQKLLKNSSFVKIKDFDERCVEIIRDSVHAEICSIYRYDDQTESLNLSATTASLIKFDETIKDSSEVINKCSIPKTDLNNVLIRVHKKRKTKYLFNINSSLRHQAKFIEISENQQQDCISALIIPMLKKDSTCNGVVLLMGKDTKNTSISTAFWEQDIAHIEFIVNILTRIAESDTERLTFLSQLAHELLSPITKLVNDNQLLINKLRLNIEKLTPNKTIKFLRHNIDRNMLFKYIICDAEFIYSSSRKSIEYDIKKQNNPRQHILDVVRLFEEEANYNNLSIRTNISEMPALCYDKDRIMQVLINLLKNAIRYSNKNSIINIYYKYNTLKSLHEIKIANYGIGIKDEEKEAIFNLFYRGKDVTNRFIRGSGLGLYIVRDIMRAHGGDCYVISLSNPTEFVITIPKQQLF